MKRANWTKVSLLSECVHSFIIYYYLLFMNLFIYSFTGMHTAYLCIASHQNSQLTTPAVIVDVGIGRLVYTTVHCQRPSVSRRRGTNMEQFASRSDII